MNGGIYFANSIRESHLKAHQHGCIIRAKVQTGHQKGVWRKDKSITPEGLWDDGFDSVRVDGRPSGPEHVVYDSSQVDIVSVRDLCQGTNGRGERCCNGAQLGRQFCFHHGESDRYRPATAKGKAKASTSARGRKAREPSDDEYSDDE